MLIIISLEIFPEIFSFVTNLYQIICCCSSLVWVRCALFLRGNGCLAMVAMDITSLLVCFKPIVAGYHVYQISGLFVVGSCFNAIESCVVTLYLPCMGGKWVWDHQYS